MQNRKKNIKLSALVVAHNEEKNLDACLSNLKLADEIVVVLAKATVHKLKRVPGLALHALLHNIEGRQIHERQVNKYVEDHLHSYNRKSP